MIKSKKLKVSFIIVINVILSFVFAESPEKPSINIIIPAESYVITSLSHYRIAGNTEPQNKVYINNKPVTVYPTGAFVFFAELRIGKNEVWIQAIAPDRSRTEKKLTFVRNPGIQDTPEDVLRIEEALMLPSAIRELKAGDRLDLRFKGTPGLNAYFSIGKLVKRFPMAELPPEVSPHNLRGIYVGYYVVKSGDRLEPSPVTFTLEKSFFRKVTVNSWAKISIIPEDQVRVGKTTSPRTYIKASLGEARLGGAQLGFLDKDVLVPIDGRYAELWRVRLGANKIAWIPQEFIEILPSAPLTRSFANAITITQEGKHDVVSLGLFNRLPYLIYEELQPPKINVEIYGARSNITWITNKPTTVIKDLTWQQINEDTLKLEIWLKNSVIWGYTAGYKEGQDVFVVKVRHPPAFLPAPASPLKGLTIAVDAGHGGANTGAVEATGVPEKTINRSTADFLIEQLKTAGASVVDVRPGDEDTTLTERLKRALEADADVYISLHANSIGEGSDPLLSRGTLTLYKYPKDRELALAIYNRLCETELQPWGVVSSFNAASVKMTEINTVLIEQAFMSHPEDEALLLNAEFRRKIAQKIKQGLDDYYSRWRDFYLKKAPRER